MHIIIVTTTTTTTTTLPLVPPHKRHSSSLARCVTFNSLDPFTQVGIASVWWEGNPCNMHLLDLSADIKSGLPKSLIGLRFNTIGVSDGISMGTPGMSFSLQSRDLIADSIETVMGAQW